MSNLKELEDELKIAEAHNFDLQEINKIKKLINKELEKKEYVKKFNVDSLYYPYGTRII